MRIELVLPTLGMIAAHASQAQSLDARINADIKGQSGAALSGVISIARRGTVILDRAYGFADADLGVANQTDLRFGIGSLTKPMTATAALRLIERGQLYLADPIWMYLHQCPPAWRAVNIERLLSHTSGLPDLFGELPAASGFSSWLGHFDDGTVVIVLSNIEDTSAKAIGCDVAAIAFGLKPSPRDADRVACRAER